MIPFKQITEIKHASSLQKNSTSVKIFLLLLLATIQNASGRDDYKKDDTVSEIDYQDESFDFQNQRIEVKITNDAPCKKINAANKNKVHVEKLDSNTENLKIFSMLENLKQDVTRNNVNMFKQFEIINGLIGAIREVLNVTLEKMFDSKLIQIQNYIGVLTSDVLNKTENIVKSSNNRTCNLENAAFITPIDIVTGTKSETIATSPIVNLQVDNTESVTTVSSNYRPSTNRAAENEIITTSSTVNLPLFNNTETSTESASTESTPNLMNGSTQNASITTFPTMNPLVDNTKLNGNESDVDLAFLTKRILSRKNIKPELRNNLKQIIKDTLPESIRNIAFLSKICIHWSVNDNYMYINSQNESGGNYEVRLMTYDDERSAFKPESNLKSSDDIKQDAFCWKFEYSSNDEVFITDLRFNSILYIDANLSKNKDRVVRSGKRNNDQHKYDKWIIEPDENDLSYIKNTNTGYFLCGERSDPHRVKFCTNKESAYKWKLADCHDHYFGQLAAEVQEGT